jgi:SAM-dependent methyltransferase
MSGGADLFLELFSGLPRLGPGGDEHTLRVLAAVEGLPERPLVLDLGCGVGRSALVLAGRTGGRVVAVDNSAAYLDALDRAARERGLEGHIETLRADMAELPVESGVADLIWAEGSIYVLGFERGLRLWRPLLRPRGWIALTEISWLRRTRRGASGARPIRR